MTDVRHFTAGRDPPARLLPDRPVKVLVVDDHPLNRCVMQAILAQFGCSVTHAFCGEEAVELAATIAFDLIVMDFHMPGISGDEAAGQIRAKGPSRLAYIAQWSTDPPGRLSAALYDAALAKPITCAAAVEILAAAQRRNENRALDHAAPQRRRARRAGGGAAPRA